MDKGKIWPKIGILAAALFVVTAVVVMAPGATDNYCFVTSTASYSEHLLCQGAFPSGGRGFGISAGGDIITKVVADNCTDLLDKLENYSCNSNWCKWTPSVCACMDIECSGGEQQGPPYCYDTNCEGQGGDGCCRIQDNSPCPVYGKSNWCNLCGESDGWYGYCCDECTENDNPCVGDSCTY